MVVSDWLRIEGPASLHLTFNFKLFCKADDTAILISLIVDSNC